MYKKLLISIIALLATVSIVYATAGTPITVPQAPGAGYVLISTSTGKYGYTSTSSLGIIGTSQWINSGSGIYYNAGNVSIGLATTSYLLDVRDGTDPTSLNLTVDNTSNTIGLTANGGGILLNPNNPTSYVGVGTELPQSAFEVSNTAQTSALLRVDNANNFVGLGTVASNDPDEFEGIRVGFPASASYPYIKIGSPGYTGNGTLFTVDDYNAKFTFINGNVGIGTTVPGSILELYGVHPVLNINANAAGGNSKLQLSEAGTAKWQISNRGGDSDKLNFSGDGGLGVEDFMVITQTGNVGIGTTTPANKLDVYGNMAVGVAGGAGGYIYGDTTVPSLQLGSSAGTILSYGTTNINIASGFMYFKTNNVEAMRITSTGNVGIGTTSPSSKLDIYGTAGSSDIFAISSSTNARLLTVTAAGKVGIGTASPTAKFQVNTAVGGTIISMSTDSNARFTDTTSSAIGVGGAFTFMGNYTGSSATLAAGIKAMKTNGTAGQWGFDLALATRENGSSELTEAMRITSTRNIGIGTTTPSSQLTVATGDIYIASSTRGIIMPDSVDGGCRRMTLASGAWVFSATSTCP